MHDFLWDELADWYIEASKVRMRGTGDIALAEIEKQQYQRTRRVLIYVWDTCMRLLHPFMPYLTEALWQQIPHVGDSVMVSDWPQLQTGRDNSEGILPVNAEAIRQFASLQAVVRSIRNARAEYNVDPGRKLSCILTVADPALRSMFDTERSVFAVLGRVQQGEELRIVSPEDQADALLQAGACVHLVVEDGVEAFLPQSGMLDPVKERARLGKQAERIAKDVEVLQSRLNSAGFVDKAPAHLVTEAKSKMKDLQDQLKTINTSLEALK